MPPKYAIFAAASPCNVSSSLLQQGSGAGVVNPSKKQNYFIINYVWKSRSNSRDLYGSIYPTKQTSNQNGNT